MRAAILVLTLLALALPVAAVVPRAERIATATAQANRAAARSQALQLDLTLRVADREPIGSGKLVTHPTGLARLELRDAADRPERHLLLGSEHSASRKGRRLDRPRAFLPPLFFLQVDSPATLTQALSDFGLDIEAASLAPCGQGLCYVLGDTSRVAPPRVVPEDSEAEAEAALLSEPYVTFGEPVETLPNLPEPTLWVDTRSFEIVRIESRSGVTVDFGPTVAFGEVRFPDSITIHEPDRKPVRFDILAVVPVNAPAAEFAPSWLLAPDSQAAALPARQP